MEKDFQKLVHDLRSHFTIICYATHFLALEPPGDQQVEYQAMLARNLDTIQSIVGDLALPKLKESRFHRLDELLIELIKLLKFLEIKRSEISQTPLQGQVNQLIDTLEPISKLAS